MGEMMLDGIKIFSLLSVYCVEELSFLLLFSEMLVFLHPSVEGIMLVVC